MECVIEGRKVQIVKVKKKKKKETKEENCTNLTKMKSDFSFGIVKIELHDFHC